MAENKTLPTQASVDQFLAGVADSGQREDAKALIALLSRVSGETATLWGPSIIGFGRYAYRYDSGRTGEMCRIGFSPRKGKTVLYIVDGFPQHEEQLARLGKHKTGKSCLYIKRLSDVDMKVLEEMCSASLASMAERYPDGS